MKVLSLFDGISCGMVAFERAGISVERYVAYEIEPNAIKISNANYPKIEQCGDVFKADFTQYKGFDILIGGSPCTYWSMARKGRETDCNGMGFQLFMEYVRALEESECRYFLYENNYSIHQNIKDEISEKLGVEPIMINSALVSAQNRKRCYWTNISNAMQPIDKGILLKDIIESGYVDRDKSLCLTRRYAGFDGTQSYLCRRYFGKSMGQAVFEGDIAEVKAAWKENPYFESANRNIRQMSVKECERLQTLPDDYTNVNGVSERMRYEAIGNGWTVDVIAHIFSSLKGEQAMIKCKQAVKFGSDCGKVCCCLECEKRESCKDICNGLKENCPDAFTEETALATMQTEAAGIIKSIAALTMQKKQIEEQEKEMRVQLVAAMEKYDVKSLENDLLKVIYVAATTRTTIDSAKLKKDLPDVAAKYSKTSNVSASVKITVKG